MPPASIYDGGADVTKDLLIRKIQHLAAAEKAKRASKATMDHQLISIDQANEVSFWTQALGCTARELREAVAAVGNSAEEVRQYLGVLPPSAH